MNPNHGILLPRLAALDCPWCRLKKLKRKGISSVRFSLFRYAGYAAWVAALAAMVISLYFSQVLHLPPCVLCWYQRILMYPLVLIIPIGLIRRDRGLSWYVLPFSILGMLVAGYHSLLQQGIIPERLAPCVAGISCATKQWALGGFLTIPLLSFLAFTFITVAMVVYARSMKHE